MATPTYEQYTKVAVGDIGTQLFWFNKTANKFEYALPVTAGAEFGGDTESFEAPETDSDIVAKLVGRTTPNDIAYTINYTSDKYQRVLSISDNIETNIYMEVLSDGSAMLFEGTSGTPTITSGDIRQITWTIAPIALSFVSNIYSLDADNDLKRLGKLSKTVYSTTKDSTTQVETHSININTDTIPTARQSYYTTEKKPKQS